MSEFLSFFSGEDGGGGIHDFNHLISQNSE